jgi:hypothetical protein
MPRYKLINGEQIQFTAEEEALRDAEEAQASIDKQNEEQKIQDAIAKKASGKAKLKSGDALTDAEISALFGDN